MTISPIEFNKLSGLPIFGDPYDEYVPSDAALRQKLPDGTSVYPVSLCRLFGIYHALLRMGDVTFAVWIRHFTDQIRHPCQLFARPANPFGTDAEKLSIYHVGPAATACYSRHREVGRETVLTAFIA